MALGCARTGQRRGAGRDGRATTDRQRNGRRQPAPDAHVGSRDGRTVVDRGQGPRGRGDQPRHGRGDPHVPARGVVLPRARRHAVGLPPVLLPRPVRAGDRQLRRAARGPRARSRRRPDRRVHGRRGGVGDPRAGGAPRAALGRPGVARPRMAGPARRRIGERLQPARPDAVPRLRRTLRRAGRARRRRPRRAVRRRPRSLPRPPADCRGPSCTATSGSTT